MEKAVVDAWFYLQQQAEARAQSNPFWPYRHWSSALIPGPDLGFDYVTDTSILLDARGVQFFLGTYYPKVLNEHAATMYLAPFADKDGARLEGGKNISDACARQRAGSAVLVAYGLRPGDLGLHLFAGNAPRHLVVRQTPTEDE